MERLNAFIGLEPELSDDRLYEVRLNLNQHPAVALGLFRQGFMTADVLRDIEEYIRHLVRSEVLVNDEDRGVPSFTGGTQRFQDASAVLEEHQFEICMDRAGENVLGLAACGMQINPNCLTFIVRDILVRPELVKEYNDLNHQIGFRTKLWTPKAPLIPGLDM